MVEKLDGLKLKTWQLKLFSGNRFWRQPTSAQDKKNIKNGRWGIVVILVATVILCLMFYLKTEISLWWQKLNTPVVVSTIPGR